MGGGVAGALYFAFGFSQSVSSGFGEVVNFYLQQNRLFGFLASLVAFLGGLLIVILFNLPVKIYVFNPEKVGNSDELEKRRPVDEIRLRQIIANAKK